MTESSSHQLHLILNRYLDGYSVNVFSLFSSKWKMSNLTVIPFTSQLSDQPIKVILRGLCRCYGYRMQILWPCIFHSIIWCFPEWWILHQISVKIKPRFFMKSNCRSEESVRRLTVSCVFILLGWEQLLLWQHSIFTGIWVITVNAKETFLFVCF